MVARTNYDIRQLSKEGLSCKKIMKLTGLSYHQVYHQINKTVKDDSTDENLDLAYKLYKDGQPLSKLARELNLNSHSLKNYLQKRRDIESEKVYAELSKVVCMAWK